jgi:hypothetical protein
MSSMEERAQRLNQQVEEMRARETTLIEELAAANEATRRVQADAAAALQNSQINLRQAKLYASSSGRKANSRRFSTPTIDRFQDDASFMSANDDTVEKEEEDEEEEEEENGEKMDVDESLKDDRDPPAGGSGGQGAAGGAGAPPAVQEERKDRGSGGDGGGGRSLRPRDSLAMPDRYKDADAHVDVSADSGVSTNDEEHDFLTINCAVSCCLLGQEIV